MKNHYKQPELDIFVRTWVFADKRGFKDKCKGKMASIITEEPTFILQIRVQGIIPELTLLL